MFQNFFESERKKNDECLPSKDDDFLIVLLNNFNTLFLACN